MSGHDGVVAVLWDLDGTLLDTESVYTRVAEEMVKPFGATFTWELKQQVMGKSPAEACRIVVNALNLPISPDEYFASRSKKQNEMWPLCSALPGAQRLVEYFHTLGIPQAVATGSSAEEYRLKTLNHSWFQFMNAVVTSDNPNVKRTKPHPDIFLHAASQLGVTSNFHKVLVFEDAPLGMQAALAAGMKVVVVPDERNRSRVNDATFVLDSLLHFDPTSFGLPALSH
ncbi:HAD family hydrolase [Pelomyxa schiedti]|nr:HAD family hydrolase [Pelomyxa schiedti]